MRYDIPTLLGMCHNGQISLDRFSGPAVDNHLVRPQTRSTRPLSEQPVNQPKTMSDSPRAGSSIPGMQPLPHPSPCTPIQSSRPILDQGIDGFQQFVKTHSSPKHQRVTAGGRIVPMESQLAVPELNLPRAGENEGRKYELTNSENTPTQAMHSSHAAGDKMNASHEAPMDMPALRQLPIANSGSCQPLHSLGYDSGYAPAFPPVNAAPGVFLQSRMPAEGRNLQYAHRAELPTQPYYPPVFPEAPVYGVGAFGVDTPAWYPNVYPLMNTHGSVAPLPSVVQPFTPVTTVSGFIPSHLHQTAITPPAFGQFPQYPAPLDTRYVNSASQWNPDTPKAAQSVNFDQTPVLTGPTTAAEMPSRKSFEEAKKKHDLLSGQLSRLDRYTALHSWEIDPESKQLFVQQRMSLVKELDTLRLYREQLDFIYGGSNAGFSNHRTQVSSAYQARSKSGRPARFAGNRVPRVAPLSSSFSHSIGPSFAPGPFVVPPIHSTHGPLRQPFMDQNMENSNLSYKTGLRSVPSGCESLTESNLLYNEQIRQADFAPVKRALHAQTTKAAFAGAGSGTTAQEGTSRLQKLYSRIEAANTRREPVGGLLQELSVVTAGLINDRSRKDDEATPRMYGRNLPLTLEGSNSGLPAKDIPSYVPERSRGMQHIRRFWDSEPSPEIPSKKLRDVSPETDDGSHSRPPSSHLSTTDSWTTVHKSDNRYFGRDSLSDERPGKRLESIWKSRPGDRLHTFEPPLTEATKVGTDGSWNKKIDTKVKPVSVIQRPSTATKGAKIRGFVAPFDGAGDIPDNDVGLSSGGIDHEPVQVVEPWYQKKQRIKASYAVVRDFLKRIENEEASMIYEYQMTGATSWW